MRLRRLGIERYGRFTDHVLEFDPLVRLVVVLGANEAGKTTALAAVTDALFGIEPQSRFDFLHPYKTMRLSATVENPLGDSLSFARLKRRNTPLIDPATDAPLADDCLAPFLGAYDRQAFLDIFGLDQKRLRDGGRMLLAGGGDLAETLLATAPGLSQVAALRDRLRDSAAKIFNPERRTASHAFYQAIDRRAQARKRVGEQLLQVEEVRRLREDAAAATASREAAVAGEIEAGLAAARARALRTAAGELRGLDADEAELAALGPLPPVPPDFTGRARALLAALETAQAEARRAQDETDAAAAVRAAIPVDGAVLDLAAEIEAADDERAAVQKELTSLPNRRAEVAEARSHLARIAAGLDLADVDALRARLPGTPLLSRAERLADQLQTTEEQARARERDRLALVEQRRAAEGLRAGLGHVADPAPARRRLAVLDGAEERERALRELDRRLAALHRDLAERTARLGHGLADADALAALPLPARAAAEAMLAAVKTATQVRENRRAALVELDEQRAIALARLHALNAGRPAPTQSVIAFARDARDALWAELRPLALGQRPPTEADSDTALRLDAAIPAADQIADERQSETQRLADLARGERDLAEIGARHGEAVKRLAEAEAQFDSARERWRTLWSASGLAVPADEGAIALLRESEAVRQARDGARTEAAQAQERRVAALLDRRECERLREEFGLPALGDAPLRLADLRHAVADLEARFQQSRDHERDLAVLERRAGEFDARAAQAAQQEAALTEEAAQVFPLLAIRPAARAEEARAALGLWREATGHVSRLTTAEHRVGQIERDSAAFAARTDALHAGLDLPAASEPFGAVRELRRRLDDARKAQALVDSTELALAARRAAQARAGAALQRAQDALADLRESSRLDPATDLAALLEPIERAGACRQRSALARRRLTEIGGGREAQELRAAIDGHDDEALARRAAEADAALEAARAAMLAAVERDTQARGALEALEKRDGAADAAQDEQDALTAIAETADRFVRDHVAARLVGAAIERYRAQHQSPIVERASRAFAGLTGGRWEGIGIDYEQDPPRLAARRNGGTLGIEALSEGTADQLFLALRIAAIEEHARRATPLPFIADDLFVSFDEARTSAGLSLLAELGELTQVIVFTHHAHVADCATRALGARAATIVLD
ncbi:MAG TPA: AAA family ATPase [Xanthobacteraceae bacterium]|nr:AAA family ATPase [Xanthobacteraceae bacterium]